MTKKDLIDKIYYSHCSYPRTLIAKAVTLFFESLHQALVSHKRVELRGFGVFGIKIRKSHQAHNPKTGDLLFIKEKKVPFFKASYLLRTKLAKVKKNKKTVPTVLPFYPKFLKAQSLTPQT